MSSLAFYILAAFAEIGGCFAIWAVVRLHASTWWVLPGALSLLFGSLLTRVDADYAGRAYAVYGGIYIAASLVWLWAIEARAPDRWDIAGAGLSIAGAAIILFGPRSG